MTIYLLTSNTAIFIFARYKLTHCVLQVAITHTHTHTGEILLAKTFHNINDAKSIAK